jgi:hypothetical protein
VTSTEQLVEAVVYAEDNGIEWFDVFNSYREAMRTVKAARKEIPDEGQIVCLLSAREADKDMFESYTAEHAYKQTLQMMQQELRESI